MRCERGRDQLAAFLGHPERRSDERLRRRRSEADDDLGPQDADLGLKPELAGGDLAPVGLFVEATLSRLPPLEVLHRVGDIDGFPVDACGDETLVEKLAGGAGRSSPEAARYSPSSGSRARWRSTGFSDGPSRGPGQAPRARYARESRSGSAPG